MAAFSKEQLVGDRIVDHRYEWALTITEGDRYRKLGDAVDEVGGAVDGIDDPQGITIHRLSAGTTLLTQNLVVGVVRADAADKGVLHQLVRMADVVAVGLHPHVLA